MAEGMKFDRKISRSFMMY